MIRIFVNVHPYTFSNELKAYAIAPEYLKTVRMKFTKQEAESSKLGGVYALYRSKIKDFLPSDSYDIDHPLHNYEYIGSLFEVDEVFYTITSHFRKFNSPLPVEIPLPNEDQLKELGLI
jgi:hypothetical protein